MLAAHSSKSPAAALSATITVLSLRPALLGLLFAVVTLLYGFGAGVVFGLNEDIIKSRLNADAAAVAVTAYKSDAAAAKAVVDKSWAYMQRAHLHAGSLGVVAVALSLLLVAMGITPGLTTALSVSLGAGSLGYSVFWMWAGFRAPGLGSTGAAKESLAWLAIPSAGLVVAATGVVAVLILRMLFSRPTAHA